MHIEIRQERPEDYRSVEELTREAFWNIHEPGCNEHYLAHLLRSATCFIPELDLVAVIDGRIVGNIMYTTAVIRDRNDILYPVISFGPISVLPSCQKQGLGRALIERSHQLARELGHTLVLIYGDPAYYSRFGYTAGEDYGICGNEGYFSPALQVFELIPGALNSISGTFCEDDVYHIDEAAATAFDTTFPPREKGYSPSQTRFLELLSMSHK